MVGISPQQMQTALEQEKTISAEDHAIVKVLAGMVKMPRSFIFKNPDEYGMQGWHDLSIPSDDGAPLEAWYIPAKGGESDKLVHLRTRTPDVPRGLSWPYGRAAGKLYRAGRD